MSDFFKFKQRMIGDISECFKPQELNRVIGDYAHNQIRKAENAAMLWGFLLGMCITGLSAAFFYSGAI